MAEEPSGLEFVLVLLTVLEDAGVLGKTLFPGTVIGLFTAANTGAGFGCRGSSYTFRRGTQITIISNLAANGNRSTRLSFRKESYHLPFQ